MCSGGGEFAVDGICSLFGNRSGFFFELEGATGLAGLARSGEFAGRGVLLHW